MADAASAPQAGTLAELLREQADLAPGRRAVVTAEGEWTFGQWWRSARRVARALADDGVGPGDTVALLAASSREWLAVAFGCAIAGARLAAINTWVKTPELDYLLTFARPQVLVCMSQFGKQDFLGQVREIVPEPWEAGAEEPGTGGWASARVPSLRRLVIIGAGAPPGGTDYADWIGAATSGDHDAAARPGSLAAPEDVALVLFTSGSTARPKGVALAHRDLVENGYQIGERQGLGPDDRLFLASPLFWSLGSANALMAALTHGTCLILQAQFDPGEALAVIEREKCTAIYTLSLMTHALLADPGYRADRVASLRRGLTFGPPSEVQRVQEELGVDLVCNLYGSTEVYGNCVVSPATAPAGRRIARSGPPLPGVEIQITDPESGLPLGPDEVGEILVRGRVSPGYLDEHGVLIPVTDQDGWFHTGDLGTVDADGWLLFTGRRSEMIKTAGINVSPAEVEDMLLGHPDVAEAAVTGAPHELRGELVVAFVRLRPGARLTEDGLRDWARGRAASYKVPTRVLVVPAFPATATGKLARRELRDLAVAEVSRNDCPNRR
jgi:fatty-acyl-CoA synthase